MFSHITHLIYDLDGLLLDTEVLYMQAATKVCAKYQKQYDWTLRLKLLGRPSLESAQDLVTWLNLPISPKTYLAERNAILENMLPLARAMPGAVELTYAMKQKNIPQAIATSSERTFFDIKSKNHQTWFQNVFDVIVTGDDKSIKAGKPAPDIFLKTASSLKTNPQQCLVFEDSPAGVEAALRANMMVIAVPDKDSDKRLLQNATMILNSLEEFQTDWIPPPDPIAS